MYVQTKRLELKPISADSVDLLVELFADEQVKQTYMVPDFKSREEAEKLAKRVQLLSEDASRNVAGIYLGEQLIGLFNQTDTCQDGIEVGYAFLPRFHNQGFATEALMGAISYFFTLGFQKVVAGAFEENAASIRVMVKSGMQKEERSDEVGYRGKSHRCVYYAARAAL